MTPEKLPEVAGVVLLLVALDPPTDKGHPLLTVLVTEVGPGRFSGMISAGSGDLAGPAAYLAGTDLGEHPSLGALSQHAKSVGEAFVAARRPAGSG